jgi:hypothetical protein
MLEPRRISCGLKGAPPGPILPLRIRLLEALPPRLSASFLPQACLSLLDRDCFPKMRLSEIPGPHDPVTDHGESAEEEGADDPTNGWIPEHMRVVRWAHDYLAAAEQGPGQHTEESPYKGKVDNVPSNRGRSLVHAIF